MVEKIKEIAKDYSKPCILASHENSNCYANNLVIDFGSKANLNEIAKNIFSSLRKVDSFHPDIIIIEGMKKSGIGIAIMNRLLKACKGNLVEI